MAITPYNKTQSKKEQVAEMFNNIAFRYDLLNSILSLGIHKGWRKKAVKFLAAKKPKSILDVASGTADFAIEGLKTGADKVTGVDISAKMLEIGKQKIQQLGLHEKVQLQLADAEQLPFSDNSFDAITVGFGVRNFENLDKGLKEMLRVLKPGGTVVILEFSKPHGLFSYLYKFYFKYITPAIGKLFSKDHRAYSYLPESVEAFPHGKEFCNRLEACGYRNSSGIALTFGVASIYTASK
jgi:demethylmenaquinone methyltransferase/2-methoxy-6-polyprenyl-1,4-benzoquinol methylase